MAQEYLNPDIEDRFVKSKLNNVIQDTIKYRTARLDEDQPREDYIELLNLSIMLLVLNFIMVILSVSRCLLSCTADGKINILPKIMFVSK